MLSSNVISQIATRATHFNENFGGRKYKMDRNRIGGYNDPEFAILLSYTVSIMPLYLTQGRTKVCGHPPLAWPHLWDLTGHVVVVVRYSYYLLI